MIEHRLPAHTAAIAAAVLLAIAAAPPAACLPHRAASPDPGDEGCTLVLLSGRATPDGRPVLLKNRDAASLDNEVSFFEDGSYRYVALVNAGQTSQVWAGVNDQGFAVMNALSYNIPDRAHGAMLLGMLMKLALQTCRSVADFRGVLEYTNTGGRSNAANFAVLDASGGVSLFEAGCRSFVECRVDDRVETPCGYLVRTNFSMCADTLGSSTVRYHRCGDLVSGAAAEGTLDLRFLLTTAARDLWSSGVDPYPLPFSGAPAGFPDAVGYVETSETINRRTTVASCAVAGVAPGEDPRLATFYAVLGQPVLCPPFPVWVAAGVAPPELDGPTTSPVCDVAVSRAYDVYDDSGYATLLNTRKLVDGTPAAHLTRVAWMTDWILSESDVALARWRVESADPADMAVVEQRIAAEGYRAYESRTTEGALAVSLAAAPNPSRGPIHFGYAFGEPPPAGWFFEIFDVAGRRVRTLAPGGAPRLLSGTVDWDGTGALGTRLPSGVYYGRIAGPRSSRAVPVTVVR